MTARVERPTGPHFIVTAHEKEELRLVCTQCEPVGDDYVEVCRWRAVGTLDSLNDAAARHDRDMHGDAT